MKSPLKIALFYNNVCFLKRCSVNVAFDTTFRSYVTFKLKLGGKKLEKENNLPIRGSLKEGNAPKALLEKYHAWLEKARTAEIPIWYSKHVRLWFVYQGIQYELYP